MKKIILKNKVKEVKHCKSVISKMIGLMFSKKRDCALVFHFKKESDVDLHMFFVFYPIDVFWLNKDKKVTDIKKNFRPFTLTGSRKAMYVIEARAGLLNINKGDIVEF